MERIDEFLKRALRLTSGLDRKKFDEIVEKNTNFLKSFYGIEEPIYEVRYVSDMEARLVLIFGYCSGEKEAIISLVDHESSVMGSRERIVFLYESELKEAVRTWVNELESLGESIEQTKKYLARSKYPRKGKPFSERTITRRKSNERLLKFWSDRYFFLKKEVGPVYKVKPSAEIQRCPKCLRRIQKGRVIKEDEGKLWGEL